ncbi:hypothetical protein BVH06_07480 [Pseudomonas sp. PA27(2017)]|nr:hypothetical protein BVH06_07480 [Pseudomonas sp. PA27(2017)]
MGDILQREGALPVSGSCTQAEVVERLQVAPRHAWIIERWLLALQRHGHLQRDSDGYAWIDPPHAPQLIQLEQLYPQLGFDAQMAGLHQQVIAQLPALLADRLTLTQMLLTGNDPVAALGRYQCNLFTASLNQLCAEYAVGFATEGSPLRVLELGGGAATLTQVLIEHLDGHSLNYHFTDLSSLFTSAARRRFRLEPGFEVSVLDIDIAFDQQQVAHAGHDLVVAGNVLHNAADPLLTLRHIHACLRPGGMLLFTESIEDNLAMLTFMHLLLSPPAQAPQRRRSDVFLDTTRWNEALRCAGFQVIGCYPDDEHPLAQGGQRLFHARRPQ